MLKLTKNLDEKKKFIEVTKFTYIMESGLYMANHQLVGGDTVQVGVPIAKEHKTVGTMTEANELVRDLPKIELAPECENIFIGSSVIGKLEIDKSIPIDCAIYAYRGSATIDKIKVLNKHGRKKI